MHVFFHQLWFVIEQDVQAIIFHLLENRMDFHQQHEIGVVVVVVAEIYALCQEFELEHSVMLDQLLRIF